MRLRPCQLHWRLSEKLSLVNTYVSAHSFKACSLFFFYMFSNLKPEPFLSLSHPWFSSQSHFSWHRKLYFFLGFVQSTHLFLSTVFCFQSFSQLHILPHQSFFNTQITFLVHTTSCAVPTAWRVVILLLLALSHLHLSVLHSLNCSCPSQPVLVPDLS